MSSDGSPIPVRVKPDAFSANISASATPTQGSVDLFDGIENSPSSSQSQAEPSVRQRINYFEIIEDNDDEDTCSLVQRASQMAVSIHSSPARPMRRSQPFHFASQISERSDEHDGTALESEDLAILDAVSEHSNDAEDEFMLESDASSDNEVLLNMSKACDTSLTRAPAKKQSKKPRKTGPLSKMLQELIQEQNAELYR